MTTASIIVNKAAKYIPPPVANPIAATVHNPDAVVKPRMMPCLKNKIVPAPINPMPLITYAATLDGSSTRFLFPRTSAKP